MTKRWVMLAKIPHFVRDDRPVTCHSERSEESLFDANRSLRF